MKNCPICGCDIFKDINWGYCEKNRCYAFTKGDNYVDDKNIIVFTYIVFDKQFDFASDDDMNYREKIRNKVMEEIKHWKENDRYLAKILTRRRIDKTILLFISC